MYNNQENERRNRGLRNEELSLIHQIKFKEIEKNEVDSCIICLNNFLEEDFIKKLRCSHIVNINSSIQSV